jgi:hypothetical protein
MSTSLKDERNSVTLSADGQTVTVRPYYPTASTVDSITFDTTAGVDVDTEGQMAWNATDGTIDVKTNGAVLQVGQEFHVKVYNNTGSQIDNGSVVAIKSAVSANRIECQLADADTRSIARATVGVATHNIANGAQGFVTMQGLVRGIDTSSFAAGNPLFLDGSTPGGLATAPGPTPPDSTVFVGVVVVASSDGTIFVTVDIPPFLTELSDVSVSSPANNDLMVYNSSALRFENKTPNVTTKQSIMAYVDRATRGKVLNIGGGFKKILDAGLFSTGVPETATNGCGKLVFNVVAGSDLVGDFTITGDTVDRNTGVITASDTETVTLAGATTDNSDTDAAGNVRHSFTGAYITTKWFQGAITITTSEVNVSDVDIWNVAFHQFGDTPTSVELDAFDVNAVPTNTAAWLYGYLYSIEVTNGACNITREASLDIPTAEIDTAHVHYRRKISGIGTTLDPSTDGVWAEVFPGPLNQTYWGDVSLFLISAATAPLTLS